MNISDITPAQYHALLKCKRDDLFHPDSWLSKSVLWELNSSSLYKWRNYPWKFTPTPAMQWGSVVDCLTTSPKLADSMLAFSEYDNYRTAAAREWRDNQLADGKIIVDQEKLVEGRKAAKMLMETHKGSAEIFAASQTQRIVHGNIRGINVKGLVDLAPDGMDFLADLKTTALFSIDYFQRLTADKGYHVQSGLYRALWNAMFPDDQRTRFKIVWQDSEAPYEVAVTELHADDIAAGWDYAQYQIGRLATASERNEWPMAFDQTEPLIMRTKWATLKEDQTINNEGIPY